MQIQTLYKLFLHQNFKISTDTRQLPEGCLFFALKGENFDGNVFAEQALEKGASYAIIDNPQYFKPHSQFILVDDTLKTLQKLALYHRKQLNIPVIAITGSNGKTTTKELTFATLSQHYKVLATRGNLNNHIGVPLTLLSITPDIEIAIIEMGANHIGEIDFLCNIACPNYGLITNIGRAHLEGFGSFEGVIQAKTELYRFLNSYQGTIFFNIDNEILKQQVISLSCRNISYGTNTNAIIRGKICENIQQHPFLQFSFYYNGQEYHVSTSLVGKYNLENALAAVAIGIHFQVDPNLIVKAIESYLPQNNRSQLVQKDSNYIICDFYNANPSSMEQALINFSQLTVNNKSKIVILGEMKELGSSSEFEHHKIAQLAKQLNFDNIYLVGECYKNYQLSNVKTFNNNQDIILYFQKNKISNSYVLIKGSRGAKLEEVYQAIF